MVVPEIGDFTAVVVMVVEAAMGLLYRLFLSEYEDVWRGLIDDIGDEEELVLKRFVGGGGGDDEETRIICCLWRFPIDFLIDLIQMNLRDWGLAMKGLISALNFLNRGPLIFGATPSSNIVLSICCLIVILLFCWLSIAVQSI